MSINNVTLVGRLTKDVDLRFTPNGVAAATFSLAVNRNFTDRKGNREADFINIVAWRTLAENVGNYCVKGSMVGVNGRIQTRNYEDKSGKKVYVTEVVANEIEFLTPKKNGNINGNGKPNSNTNQSNANPFDGSKSIDISDDDLPF